MIATRIRAHNFLWMHVGFLAFIAAPATPATPSFSANHEYVSPGPIALGDVNGDGFPDIVRAGQTFEVLLGSSTGTFQPASQPSSCFPGTGAAPALADFNGDGKLDVAYVYSNGEPDNLAVCFGNGEGSFQTASNYRVSDSLSEVIGTGDFNGDHVLDVAVLGGLGVWIFAGNGDGTFQPGVLAVTSTSPIGSIAVADFSGDGALDFVLSTIDGVAVMLGNGNGTFQPPLSVTTKEASLITVGDLNLDGNPDLVLQTGAKSKSISVYLGKGDGTFSGPTYPTLAGSRYVAIGDVNLDGKPDLVSDGSSDGLDSTNIALGNGKGQFAPPASIPSSYPTWATGQIFLVDLRNNGRLDIVEAGSAYVSVMLNEGKGSYNDGVLAAGPNPAGCATTADFNLDGRPDLAVSSNSDVYLFTGTGSATAPFAAGPVTPVTNVAGCLYAGDFNNDGIPDLLVLTETAQETEYADVYLGAGNGTFALASSTSAGAGGAINGNGSVAVADFNHDGNLDSASINNLLMLGNGDGTFRTPVSLIPSCTPSTCQFVSIATADLNGDGWADLVISSSGGLVWVLINNQQGGFVETTFSGSSNSLNYASLADLNGDGIPDLFLAGENSSGGLVYLGNGQGGFTYKETLSGTSKVGSAMIADINGDGVADIEISCTDATAIFLGNGDGTFAAPFFLGPGLATAVLAMNLHGQAPNSGTPDLVYPYEYGYIIAMINQTK